jgi:protein-tyrosine phosphatase
MRFVWIIKNKLAQSEYPSIENLCNIRKEGIRAIVSLERRNDEFKAKLREKKFKHLEEHIEDYHAPTMEQLFRIIDFIDFMIKNKKPVLVHCFVGSRSGAVLVSYLIYHGKSLKDALVEISKIIPATADYSLLIDALIEFENKCKQKRSEAIKSVRH